VRPCITAFPKLSRLQDDFGGSGFQVQGVAVYSGTREDVTAFLTEHPVTYPIVVGDEGLTERFGLIGYPTSRFASFCSGSASPIEG
jgi:hypothetical protein